MKKLAFLVLSVAALAFIANAQVMEGVKVHFKFNNLDGMQIIGFKPFSVFLRY